MEYDIKDKANNNKVIVSGEIMGNLEFSHEVFNEKFYTGKFKVERLSGVLDILPITISQTLINKNFSYKDNLDGLHITIQGQVRSYNKLVDGKMKLILTLFVNNILPYEELESFNSIEISGYICQKPIYRITARGREICDIMLAVNRTYNKSDYIPCIAWGKNAEFADLLKVGTHLAIEGRLQSREYKKLLENGEIDTRTAYELSVGKITVLRDNN